MVPIMSIVEEKGRIERDTEVLHVLKGSNRTAMVGRWMEPEEGERERCGLISNPYYGHLQKLVQRRETKEIRKP